MPLSGDHMVIMRESRGSHAPITWESRACRVKTVIMWDHSHMTITILVWSRGVNLPTKRACPAFTEGAWPPGPRLQQDFKGMAASALGEVTFRQRVPHGCCFLPEATSVLGELALRRRLQQPPSWRRPLL